MKSQNTTIALPGYPTPDIAAWRRLADFLARHGKYWFPGWISNVEIDEIRASTHIGSILKCTIDVHPSEVPAFAREEPYILGEVHLAAKHFLSPPDVPSAPWWLEKVLGKADIPWGKTVKQDDLLKGFQSWIGREISVELEANNLKSFLPFGRTQLAIRIIDTAKPRGWMTKRVEEKSK